MRKQRLYNLSYRALRFFHWALFFVIVEIMFWYAGWMIFGLIDLFLSAPISAPPHPEAEAAHFFPLTGKIGGLLAGAVFTHFVMGRYRKSDNR